MMKESFREDMMKAGHSLKVALVGHSGCEGDVENSVWLERGVHKGSRRVGRT